MPKSLDGTLFEGLDAEQLAAIKWAAETSQSYFCRLMFRARERQIFRHNPMAELVNDTLDRVFSGELTRLIISMPPGMGKTLQCVIMFAARGFALNPRSRVLHVSYSDTLVQQNSQAVRDIIGLPEFQALWPLQLRQDTSSKGLWLTDLGGSFKASPSAGEVTGFRAGTLDAVSSDDLEDFVAGERDGGGVYSGALLIDDPLKPDDARSDERRNVVNLRFNNTLRSRLAHEGVPILLTGQRVGPMDLSGYLLTGGGGEIYHHLMLPVEIKRPTPVEMPRGSTLGWQKPPLVGKDGTLLAPGKLWPLEPYPTEYTHGERIEHNLPPGPLWPLKYDTKEINVLRSSPSTFASQYMQDPKTATDAVFKPALFKSYQVRPTTMNIAIMGDPSGGGLRGQRKADRTALIVLGVDSNRNKYLLDGYCHRMSLSERWENLRNLYKRWSNRRGVVSTTVGYERFGMQTDQEYFEERMEVENIRFSIKELMWAHSGSSSKIDRIKRLEPDFVNNRFFFPARIYKPEFQAVGADGQPVQASDRTVYWTGNERTIEFRPAFGPTSAQRDMLNTGNDWLVADVLMRRDENSRPYDLTWLLMQELLNLGNAEHDDAADATARIYDMDITPVNRVEDTDIAHFNAQLVE